MRLVVGAAIVRDGCVLAARRTTPPEAAGRWEFPGGKVEAGETPESALVREIGEELGCLIEVTGWLAGTVPIRDTHELRVATARLVDGEPSPHEHDAVRWLGPEELCPDDDTSVDWLGPDRPFLAELRELLLDGSALNTDGVVRIGDTVRRPTGPWTPAVHALLGHLRAAGLRGVPRVHGLDVRGREVLDFLPGEVVEAELVSEQRLRELAQWTREFHEAVAGFAHPGPWRSSDAAVPGRIGHGDLAPYNVAFAGDEIAGVFDWDFAGPTTKVAELAHQAWNAVPLFRDIGAEASARRLEALAQGYGEQSAADLLDAVVGLLAAGEPQHTGQAHARLVERLPAIRAYLERLSSGSGA